VKLRLSRVGAPAILLVGALLFLLYAYPGYVTADAADMLVDSRVGLFTDWHSPMLTEIWRIVGFFVSGPAGMVILQSVLFLGGAFCLLRRAMSERAAAVVACCVLLSPPVIACMAVISPESQLAGFLIAAAAAIASDRRGIRIAGLGLALVASGMREGAALAVIPVVLLGFVWREGDGRWRRYAIAAAAGLVIVVASALLNRALIDADTGRKDIDLAALDITGTIHCSEPRDDAGLLAELSETPLVIRSEIQQHAHELSRDPERAMHGAGRLFGAVTSDAEREAIVTARREFISAHPSAYVAHRLSQFARVLGLKRGKSWAPVFSDPTETVGLQGPLQHAARHSSVQSVMVRMVRALKRTLLFHPYVYLLLAVAILPMAAIRRRRDAATLLASGIGYELALMFVTTTAEFRFSLWLIVSTILGISILIAQGITATRTSSPRFVA
jgi:hypothetical protein